MDSVRVLNYKFKTYILFHSFFFQIVKCILIVYSSLLTFNTGQFSQDYNRIETSSLRKHCCVAV